MITPEEREREQTLFASERARVPDLFEREPMLDSEEFLRWIGITLPHPQGPIGYVKYFPSDFIVEEIGKSGEIITADATDVFSSQSPEENSFSGTVFADLVKINIGTLEARHAIAEMLRIPSEHIGFAGIKDRLAITTQRISIKGVSRMEALRNISHDVFFLKNISAGKGVVQNGDLQGNRFTITVRMPSELSHVAWRDVQDCVTEVEQKGFWNFFHFQRFGTPRLLAHWLGLLLTKRDYEEAVKVFVTHSAERELPYFKAIRAECASVWGDWQHILQLLDRFPYHFQQERTFLRHLEAHPHDFLGALRTLPDQVRLWFYAYDSFLFNRKLSDAIHDGAVPDVLPLFSSFNSADWAFYRDYTEADGITEPPSKAYKDFPFVRITSRTWPTRQRADIHGIAKNGKIVALSFTLPKGAYATTLLMHCFTLANGLPIVPGIPEEECDPKDMLHLGSIQSVRERFSKIFDQREEHMKRGEE